MARQTQIFQSEVFHEYLLKLKQSGIYIYSWQEAEKLHQEEVIYLMQNASALVIEPVTTESLQNAAKYFKGSSMILSGGSISVASMIESVIPMIFQTQKSVSMSTEELENTEISAGVTIKSLQFISVNINMMSIQLFCKAMLRSEERSVKLETKQSQGESNVENINAIPLKELYVDTESFGVLGVVTLMSTLAKCHCVNNLAIKYNGIAIANPRTSESNDELEEDKPLMLYKDIWLHYYGHFIQQLSGKKNLMELRIHGTALSADVLNIVKLTLQSNFKDLQVLELTIDDRYNRTSDADGEKKCLTAEELAESIVILAKNRSYHTNMNGLSVILNNR